MTIRWSIEISPGEWSLERNASEQVRSLHVLVVPSRLHIPIMPTALTLVPEVWVVHLKSCTELSVG